MTSSHKPDEQISKVEAEDSDHLQSWSSRWVESRIGFHITNVHEFLLKHGEIMLLSKKDNNSTAPNKKRVLVPLCGKTVDLTYLAKHNSVEEVVGAEGITKAILEYIDENVGMSKNAIDVGAFEKYKGDNIVLLKGNFFHLSESYTGGKFDIIWDRGSIVAINPKDREHYIDKISKLLKPGGSILVVTIDRTDNCADELGSGPPFSINESDIRSMFEHLDWVDKIELLDKGKPDDRQRYELCFQICAKSITM